MPKINRAVVFVIEKMLAFVESSEWNESFMQIHYQFFNAIYVDHTVTVAFIRK
ncbi:hypothetical protein JCM19037_2000 [Geomicrobium sp. JCM 19037]|nr:hypothetical protein JCM19037_2000 [Geomicrobium sp. JCM 19037]